MTLTRDEFEEWIQQHSDEVLDRMNQTPRSLNGWMTSYLRTMALIVSERGGDDDLEDLDAAFGGAENDSLFGDGEDY